MTLWDVVKKLHLFGLGAPVDVYLSYSEDGSVNGVYASGSKEQAQEATQVGYVDCWTVNGPEFGRTRFWTRPLSEEEAKQRTV